ncbi:unnamed protein product, partial [Prorocentrum cordatum]
ASSCTKYPEEARKFLHRDFFDFDSEALQQMWQSHIFDHKTSEVKPVVQDCHPAKYLEWRVEDLDRLWTTIDDNTLQHCEWTLPPDWIQDSLSYKYDPETAIELGSDYGRFTSVFENFLCRVLE